MTVANTSKFNIATPSIFLVYQHLGTGNGVIIGKAFGPSGRTWRKLEAYPNHWRSGADSNRINFAASGGFNVLGLVSRSNTDHSILVNGTETKSTTPLYHTNYNSATLKLGAAKPDFEHANGNLVEVIMYRSALSDADRRKVECYLAARYNLTVSNCP